MPLIVEMRSTRPARDVLDTKVCPLTRLSRAFEAMSRYVDIGAVVLTTQSGTEAPLVQEEAAGCWI